MKWNKRKLITAADGCAVGEVLDRNCGLFSNSPQGGVEGGGHFSDIHFYSDASRRFAGSGNAKRVDQKMRRGEDVWEKKKGPRGTPKKVPSLVRKEGGFEAVRRGEGGGRNRSTKNVVMCKARVFFRVWARAALPFAVLWIPLSVHFPRKVCFW